MQPVPVGSRIRVVSNDFNHSYVVGDIYTITHVDRDGTFRAADSSGRAGNWLRWSECAPASASTWMRLAADLPEPLVQFLSCFDGIGAISIKEQVIDAVLAKLPDLHERIVAVATSPAGEAAIAGNRPAPLHPPEPTPPEPF